MIRYCFHNNNPVHFTIIKDLQMINLKFAFRSMIDRSGFDRSDRSFSRIVWPLVLSPVLLILVLEAFTWVPHWGGMKASLFGSTGAHCGHAGGVYLSKLRAWKALKVNDSMSTVSDLWCWPWRPQEESTSALSATVALATTPSSACDWWLTQITSASGVTARLGTSTSGQWLNRC